MRLSGLTRKFVHVCGVRDRSRLRGKQARVRRGRDDRVSSIPSVSRTFARGAPWPTKAAVLIDPTSEVRPLVAELAP